MDDCSRFAYAEALPGSDRGVTTADFLLRAVEAFALAGIRVERVLTDNAKNYCVSRALLETAAARGIALRKQTSLASTPHR